MVPSRRRALRARLLSFRYIDGVGLERPCLAAIESDKDKVMAGGTPANPAALVTGSGPARVLGQTQVVGGGPGTRTGSAAALPACSDVMNFSETIAASTDARRWAARVGFTVGAYKEGPWVTPASNAYWESVRLPIGA